MEQPWLRGFTTPVANNSLSLFYYFSLHKQFAERGVGIVNGRGIQNDLSVAGQIEFSSFVSVIGYRYPAQFHVVIGDDSNLCTCRYVKGATIQRCFCD